MKWINHKITTFSIVFLITKDVVSSLAAAAGSIIPDAIEGHNYDSDRWRRNHRRLSHWLLGYVLLATVIWFFIYRQLEINILKISLVKVFGIFKVYNSETLIYILSFFGFYFCTGAILHILEDALSSTVPVLHPTKRVFTLGLIKTGSFIEYLLSSGLLIFALLLMK